MKCFGRLIAIAVMAALPVIAQAQIAPGSGLQQQGAVTANDASCWAGNGVLKDCGFAPIGGLTVGTTTITSGTNTRILYDNNGVLGEYTISGTGATVPMAAGAALTGLTGLGIRDTSAAFDVTIAAASSATLTAGRILTLNMGNVAHILTLGTTASTGSGIIFPNTATDTVAMLAIGQTFSATQTIIPAANTAALISTGYSLTGSNAQSLLDLSGTLNTTGSPDVMALRVTDTARGASTKLFNIYGGASGTTSYFSVDRLGGVVFAGNNASINSNGIGAFNAIANSTIAFAISSLGWFTGTPTLLTLTQTTQTGTGATYNAVLVDPAFQQSSGSSVDNTVVIAPTINFTSTFGGSYNALLINVTETSVTGATAKNLINAQVNNNTKFSVDDTGSITAVLANVATTSAVCYNTGTGLFSYDSTIGTCNTSTKRVKHDIVPLRDVSMLTGVMRMEPSSFFYNDNEHTPGQQLGFIAEQLAEIDPRLVSYDQTGQPNAIRFLGPMFSYAIGAIKELKADNDNLKAAIEELKRAVGR